MKLQRETKNEISGHGRWYGDACGTAFAMELIGERWSLLVVRELMFGARRFSDIRASLPGISAKVLTERLASLEEAGVLSRRQLPPPGKVQVYELTEWGYAAEPLVQELGRWAARSSGHDPTLPLSPISFMLSLRTMFDATAAQDMKAVTVFVIGTAQFTARLAGGAMPVTRGAEEAPDLRFEAPAAPPLAAVFYGDEAPETVGVHVTGEQDLREKFISLFNLPSPYIR